MANKKSNSPLLRAAIYGSLIRATSKPKTKTITLDVNKEIAKMDASGRYFGEKYRKLTPDGRLFASDGNHGVNVKKPCIYNGKPTKVVDAKYEGKWGWDYLVEVKPGVNAWVGNSVTNIKKEKHKKS